MKYEVDKYWDAIHESSRSFLDTSIQKIVAAKKSGGKVVVATGSGPNIHEGVTTLIAEMIHKGLVDGVLTSSAVIAHEMGGVLDRVKRVDGRALTSLGDKGTLPRGDVFELTEMGDQDWHGLAAEMILDNELVRECREADGPTIIKAAGNMAYPMGLRSERLADEILNISRTVGKPFEVVAGWGADDKTMIGAGSRMGVPVLVSVPQLVGGGSVGLAVGDSIPISQRCSRIADLLGKSDVIIESAVALTQEIHDGPFETYTGHGIWAGWTGYQTYSLKDKTLIRIDIDENLKKAWDMDKLDGSIQSAIDKGLPKTKMTNIPFRMEMSAFTRLENSIPIVGDIGVVWPLLASRVSEMLDIELDFMSHPQQTPEGMEMRNRLVDEIRPIDRKRIVQKLRSLT